MDGEGTYVGFGGFLEGLREFYSEYLKDP